MAHTLNAVALLALLCAAGAWNAVDDQSQTTASDDFADEISLMQVQKTLTPGIERSDQQPQTEQEPEKVLEADEVKTEAFTLEDTTLTATTPPGCHDMGCQGTGPNCGGNSFDCTSHGWVVTGWYKTCNEQDTCSSGWKVRCAMCPAGNAAKPLPMPAPSASPTLWTAPAPPPTAAPGPAPKPAPEIVLPTNAPLYVAAKFDSQGVNKSQHALASAKANLTIFKQALSNATKAEKSVHDNITKFESMASHAESEFETNRDAAVHFAKKVELANITIWKASKAMANAYYAEKGAAQAAQNSLLDAKNANAELRHAEKELVDKVHEAEEAKHALDIGNTAVKKAESDLALAKKAADDYYQHERKHDKDKMAYEAKMVHWAMQEAVQKTAQEAYIESSVGRNDSNVPPMSGAGASV